MNFKSLSQQAKRLLDRRGGTDSLKEDAQELRDIAKGEGSLSDKAKAGAAAVKEPGAAAPADAGAPRPADEGDVGATGGEQPPPR